MREVASCCECIVDRSSVDASFGGVVHIRRQSAGLVPERVHRPRASRPTLNDVRLRLQVLGRG